MPRDSQGRPLVVVLDVANVMGSRPDGWWRDRAAAAERVLAGAVVVLQRRGAEGEGLALDGGVPPVGALGDPSAVRVVAVLEGRARSARAPGVPGLHVVLAGGEGDDDVVAAAEHVVATGGAAWVVTADRGLRQRLPAAAVARGPRWWLDLVEEASGSGGPAGPAGG